MARRNPATLSNSPVCSTNADASRCATPSPSPTAESAAPADDPDWRAAAEFAATTPAPAFPVRGADLVARGVRPGKALGAALKALQAKWIRAGFPRDPAIVKRLVDEAVAGSLPGDVA